MCDIIDLENEAVPATHTHVDFKKCFDYLRKVVDVFKLTRDINILIGKETIILRFLGFFIEYIFEDKYDESLIFDTLSYLDNLDCDNIDYDITDDIFRYSIEMQNSAMNRINILEKFIEIRNAKEKKIKVKSQIISTTTDITFIEWFLNKCDNGDIVIDNNELNISTLIDCAFKNTTDHKKVVEIIKKINDTYVKIFKVMYATNLLEYIHTIDISVFEDVYGLLTDLGFKFTIDLSYGIRSMTEEIATIIITLHSDNRIKFCNEDKSLVILGDTDSDICIGTFILIDYILSYRTSVTIQGGFHSDSRSFVYSDDELFKMLIKYLVEGKILFPFKSKGIFNYVEMIKKLSQLEILFQYYLEHPNILSPYVDFTNISVLMGYDITYTGVYKEKYLKNIKLGYDFYLNKYNLGYDFMVPSINVICLLLNNYPHIIHDVYNVFNLKIVWHNYFFARSQQILSSKKLSIESIGVLLDYIDNKPIEIDSNLNFLENAHPDYFIVKKN